MKTQIFLLSAKVLFLPAILLGGNPSKGETDSIVKPKLVALDAIQLEDDPFAARLDSILSLSFFEDLNNARLSGSDSLMLANTKNAEAPRFSDSIYAERLQVLNELSPMALDYNSTIKSYIELYSLRRREQVSKMLGLAQYYFPMFEQALDKYDMPLELKYLAVVESALNPMARSRVGATGLWQFMYATGKMNGLSVNSYIDERNDPLKSTEAACQYLTQLYRIFDDWNLALAAYNSGPGNVNKAIRRSGGKKDYWAIRPFLPRETASYVPAFIAVNYIMAYYEDHLIYPTQIKPSFFSTDTVNIKERISFEQITKLVDISEEELEFLNPAYRHKLIPKKSKGSYPLILPQDKIGLFVSNEDSIYKIAAQHFIENKAVVPAETPMSDRVRHRVGRGEVLGTIAEKYGVSVRSIRNWNGLRGNTIRLGQRLTIYPRRMPSQKVASSTTKKSASKKSSLSKTGEYQNYRVQNGETFYSIAKKYPGVSAQNIMSWNGINNARRLKPGMTLKIYSES
jgi:membrane-bound lytic murein transglycosylase D